jgi:hypothetical protein
MLRANFHMLLKLTFVLTFNLIWINVRIPIGWDKLKLVPGRDFLTGER